MDIALAAIITGVIVSALETVVMYYMGNGNKKTRFIQDQSNKIQKLENELEQLKQSRSSSDNNSKESRDSKFYETQLRNLEKDVDTLKHKINEKFKNDSVLSLESEDLNMLLQKLNSDYQGANQKISDLDTVFYSLKDSVIELKKHISILENQSDVTLQSQKLIEEMNELTLSSVPTESVNNGLQELSVQVKMLENQLEQLEQKFNEKEMSIVSPPESKPVSIPPTSPPLKTEERIINPDNKYICFLLEQASKLAEPMGNDCHYKSLIKKLEEIKSKGDFNDPEEIMSGVYQTLENDVYKSFQRVAIESVPMLKSYVEAAGFSEVKINEGDYLKGNENIWDNVFHESTTDSLKIGRIKQIQRHPYQIWYDMDGERKLLILRGQCTCYKGV